MLHTPRTNGVAGHRKAGWPGQLLQAAAGLVIGACVLGGHATVAHAAAMEAKTGQQECDNGSAGTVPGCRSLTTRDPYQYNVRAGTKRFVRFTCRPDAPYFWNWSTTLTRGMQVTLTRVLKDSQSYDIGGIFELHEQGRKAAGAAKIYLGCSTSQATYTTRMQGRSLDAFPQR